MFTLLLTLTLPILQSTPPPGSITLSTRWHPTVVIETGLKGLAFAAICPTKSDSGGNLFAVDSAGNVAELDFVDGSWRVISRTSIGERVVSGCGAAMRPDEIWSLVVGTESGKVIELRRNDMAWGRYEITTAKTPIRAVRASDPGKPGPSQVFVIDADGAVSNWYVGASGRWNQKAVPALPGGVTHICFDYRNSGLHAITAGPKGIIGKFIQDSVGDWGGSPWDTMSSGCLDLAASSDPSMADICLFYTGLDGHFRYLFAGRRDDVTSRLDVAEGAVNLIGKGDQRRFNEFFGLAGTEYCLFEYNPDILEWVKVPIRSIPGKIVATIFGPARGTVWHTFYVATSDGRLYEFERDGLEGM